ncbi:TetR family transcriptional regulator [Pseudoroseicyclus aestuarii]|uniref:TetR family transcriptional regulator n=2 Tax=Pseudoroseicyclus aestuarii TaxID=1795041 RepID=A0A318SNC0_9RHOB|nr:TetR family transcriptional regulator [Pseudoroseicyclus aestuarii]
MVMPPPTSPVPRVGRPRRDEAGAVNARILAAATDLFLERGLAATSCEAVAARARVGKASLYARYAGKEALFEAVVQHALEGRSFRWQGPETRDAPPAERLALAGRAVLSQALQPVPLELMRLFMAEARRFPALIAQVERISRGRVLEVVSRALVPETPDPQVRARADAVADRFLDLTFAPIIVDALMGREGQTAAEAVDRRIVTALEVLGHEVLTDPPGA